MTVHVGLTQKRVLSAIRSLTRKYGYPPTYAELAKACRVAKPTIHYWIGQLSNEGLVSYEPGKARTLSIKGE